MWCACPTRSPHSPSASSCPKPIPLLNLRPSPVEWAPYPTARTVPRMCERFFCTPAQVPPAFLPRTPAYSRPEPPPPRAKFPPPLAHPPLTSRKLAHSCAELPPSRSVLPPSRTKFPPPLAHPSPTSRKLAHSRSVLPLFCAELPPSRSVPPSVGTSPAEREGKAPHRYDAPRRHPRLHRTRHKNAPTLPRLGEKT